MVDLTVKLVTPTVPNYVALDVPGLVLSKDQDRPKVRVADLTDEQLDRLAEQWLDDLKKNAERQRKEPDAPLSRGGVCV